MKFWGGPLCGKRLTEAEMRAIERGVEEAVLDSDKSEIYLFALFPEADRLVCYQLDGDKLVHVGTGDE